MIRIAIDHCAANRAARTGIGRYIVELTRALGVIPEARVIVDPSLDLWGGMAGRGWPAIAGAIRGLRREYLELPARVRDGIDVYHATALRAPGRRLPLPVVVTVHDLAAFEFPGLQGFRRGLQLRGQVRRAVEHATLVIVCCHGVQREVATRFPKAAEKVRVVPLGVGELFHRPRRPGNTATFVTVATMERRKNLTTLVDAFAQVLARRPDARLRIIGQRQNDSAAVNERLARQGLTGAVSLEGFLSDEAVADAYASATGTVYPSLYEGFGLPVAESMAAGTPVVASDIPSLQEVAGGAALLVDPLDPASMAAGMLRLIEDPVLNDTLSVQGRARAAELTWARCAERHLEVYKEAVALYGKVPPG